MSGYPLLLEGDRVEALIVGGGRVAQRKLAGLIESGATVRVVAPEISPGVRELAASWARASLTQREYAAGDVGSATLVIAATDSRSVNERVAADARSAGRLVIVTDSPGEGNCTSMATHRTGGLVIGVSAAGVPNAAARIRDAASVRFDARYAAAVDALRILRGQLAGSGDSEAWAFVARDLLGADFCSLVESGEFADRAARWVNDERGVPHRGDVAWR
jgi:siroheme synthase-like protein